MPAPLLALTDIHIAFGPKALLAGADLEIGAGERICLVGRNGSGKSTLLRVAAGDIEADSGERVTQTGTTIRYLPQEPDLSGFATVLDYASADLGPHGDDHRPRLLLEALGLKGNEQPEHLSGGEIRRAAIARTLAPEPDILLLDEPTNHLDLPAIEWLEAELMSMRSALVLISHDRRFLERLSRKTVWLDRGIVRVLDRGFESFEAWRDDVLEQEEVDRHKLDRKIVREEHWLRYGVTARRKRNVRRVAELQGLRQQRREARRVQGNVTFTANDGPMSGKLVLEASGLGKSFGDRPLVNDLDLRIGRGDRLGIVGPNGAGKTTLINLLTGALEPDSGSVRHGAALEVVTLDQKREALSPDISIAEALTGGRGDTVVVGGEKKHVASYMKDFLFETGQARTPLRVLSGGERGRLMLARALAKPSNLLILDEPTNDLDLETLDLLVELVADYSGTVLVVSHDRDFLDRVVTSVLFAEGDGRWTEYAGGYSDMVAQRGEGVQARVVAKATEPRAAVTSGTPAARRKLSFKEKHALETLPAEINQIRAEIDAIEREMTDPALYQANPVRFQKSAERIKSARTQLDQMEELWLELEIRREGLEG